MFELKEVITILVIPGVLFGFIVISLLRDIKRSTDSLIAADTQQRAANGKLIKTMDALVHYSRWTAQTLTGKEPPPPL